MRNKFSLCRGDVGGTCSSIVGQPSGDRRYSRLRHIAFVLLFLMAGLGQVWGADEPETIATATFDGKNETYTGGWSTTGTGKGRNDCITIGKDEKITSPAIDLSSYESIKISIKGRRYGTLTGSKAAILVSFGGVELGTTDASGTNATTQLTDIEYTINETTSKKSTFVFTCSNATSAGSTHGAGINTITITGVKKAGGDDTPAKTLTGVVVSGTPIKTSYYAGDEFEPAGLVVTGYYDDETNAPIASGITWSYETSSSLVEDQTSINVKATVNEITSAEWYEVSGLTVAKAPTTVTFNYADYKGKGTQSSGSEYTMEKSQVTIGDTKFYGNNFYAHFYANSETTITPAAGVTITKIVLTASANDYNGYQSSGTVTASNGSLSANEAIVTWTGSADEAFTISHNKQIRWTSIVVTYEQGEAPAVAKPTISGETPFVGSTEVTITAAGADDAIYYTLDGTDPTASSTRYTAAFTLDATATVKAIAVKGDDISAVASKEFTKVTPLTIEDVLRDISSTEGDAFLLNDVTVTYANGSNVYVKDATGSIMIYSAITGAANGKVLQGLQGKAELYKGLPEVSTVTKAPTVTDGTAVEPVELNAYPTSEDLNKYVKLEDVTFASAATLSGSVANINGTFKETTLILRNQFELNGVSVATGKSYSVVGIVQKYNDDYQVYPITITEIVVEGAPEAPVFTPAAGTYTEVQNVTISCTTEGAAVYYTTNGDTPDNTSTLYSSPIEVEENMTIKAIAVKDEKESAVASAEYVINLPEDVETSKTWDLTKDEMATASADELTWTSTYVGMSITRGTSTDANNYCPPDKEETRVYNGATLTITPNGKQITSIVFETNGATPFKNATWTNGEFSNSGNTVTITVSAPGAVVAEFQANTRIYSVTVNYGPIDESFPVAPTFSVDGGTYTSVQSVELSCATEGATIYYTTDGSIPTSESTEYTAAITVDVDMTIKAIAINGEKAGPIATAAYKINLPLTTIDAILTKATAIGGTQQEVQITFNNWVVSGVGTDDKTVYVTDGTKGFVIYGENHGFVVNDKLSGTVACDLKLYNKFAEVVGLKANAEGLTVSHDGVVDPADANIADLGAVNTGAPIILSSVKFDGTNFTDGTNTIKPYNILYAYEALTENKYYNVKGIYVHYNTTKEIAPRSAEDIELIEDAEAPAMAWYVDNTKTTKIGASYTINIGDAFAPYFETNSSGELTYSSSDETVAEISASGELTLKNKVGTTVITCAVAAAGDYLADSKSFTLNVINATIDNVVIVAEYDGGYIAMKHDMTALVVSYSEGKIWDLSAEDQAAITWRRTVNENNVTFQDPSTYNYLKGSTSTTLSVAAGASGNYVWTWNETYYRVGTQTRTFLYQSTADAFKNYAESNAGQTGYSELPQVVVAVFDVTPVEPTKDVIRGELSNGKWGTLCPKQNVEDVEGAVFYQISYLEEQGGLPYNMVFDEIAEKTLTAGKPYFFIANASEIKGVKSGEELTEAGSGENGFYGYIGANEKLLLSWHTNYEAGKDNTYVIYNNKVVRLNGNTYLPGERCYININATEPSRAAVNPAPARRRITMGVQNTNVATGLENDGLMNDELIKKVLINGQLYIMYNGTMYNVQGQLVK